MTLVAQLTDMGTLDTVVEVTDMTTGESITYTFDPEFASEWRDEEGVLDLRRMWQDYLKGAAYTDFEIQGYGFWDE